jgi:hypothetical protein
MMENNHPIDVWLTPVMMSVITLGFLQLVYSALIGPVMSSRFPLLAGEIDTHLLLVMALEYVALYVIFLLILEKQHIRISRMGDDILERSIHAIEGYSPTTVYPDSERYRAEMGAYLRENLSGHTVEVHDHWSKPPIVIDTIAVDVKGPADDHALETLSTNCLQYARSYRSLIVVLFDRRFSSDHYDDMIAKLEGIFQNVTVILK